MNERNECSCRIAQKAVVSKSRVMIGKKKWSKKVWPMGAIVARLKEVPALLIKLNDV